MMTLSAVATSFAAGYLLAAIAVIIAARIHDNSWASGPVMLGLSLPVTIVYFFGLWSLRRWQLLSPTSCGMAIAGILCAAYPAFCGFFPVYFVRFKFAIPLVAVQFALLMLASAICARFQTK